MLEQRGELGQRLLHALLLGEDEPAGLAAVGHRQHARLELGHALAGHRHDRHHRTAQLAAQALGVKEMPRLRATSIMFSASISGTPISRSWTVR